MKKNVIVLFAVTSLILLGILFLRRPSSKVPDPAAVAVGLRGESRVSKSLSQTQQERLESHFLDMPPMPASRGTSGGPVPSAVSQVNAINKFNQSQGSGK